MHYMLQPTVLLSDFLLDWLLFVHLPALPSPMLDTGLQMQLHGYQADMNNHVPQSALPSGAQCVVTLCYCRDTLMTRLPACAKCKYCASLQQVPGWLKSSKRATAYYHGGSCCLEVALTTSSS